jgi:plasmid stability protein
MGQVIVRNLDDAVIETHRRRGEARGVSLEEELRDVLSQAAKLSRGSGSGPSARFAP